MNRKSISFYELFEHVDFVEIPIIQRDYAQGRVEQIEVRSLFLDSLTRALTEEKYEDLALDLDFVYGYYTNNADGLTKANSDNRVFAVLDGQQRLTTLFLLHWYLALTDGQLENFRNHFLSPHGQSKFTYRTRPSTNEFFNALVASNLTDLGNPVSSVIRDCQWFYLSWEKDPTVRSALCMLDAIQQRFSRLGASLYSRLTNIDKPCITFQFLDLDSFGLSDDLYIKMNARGKPLTVFESFKAKLEQHLSSFDGSWPEYFLSFQAGKVEGSEYFNHKVDTDWADLFWPYRNASSKDDSFDDEVMNFFRLIILIQSAIDSREDAKKLSSITTEMLGASGRLTKTSFSKYEDFDCFSQGMAIRSMKTLDLIFREGVVDGKISSYLGENTYFDENRCFKKVISNDTSYDDKLLFFAFYSYLSVVGDQTGLGAWMRIIFNLVENTITDSADLFCKRLFAIHDFCAAGPSALDALRSGYEIPAFGIQALEETIKAHLILRSEEWRLCIVHAEMHFSFKGQIGSLLKFSGILAFYREHKNCDWSDEDNQIFIQAFCQYFESLSAIFDSIKNGSSELNYAWERAVLCKGVYCTEASRNRLNLLHSQDTRNNIPRDHSWRRRLRIGNIVDEVKHEFIKSVLDDPLFDARRIEDSLEEICSRALESEGLEEWRKLLIRHPAVFRYTTQGFIAHSEHETMLLSQSQRNHYHCSLFCKSLEIELNQEPSLLIPFQQAKVTEIKSREDDCDVVMKTHDIGGQIFWLKAIEKRKLFCLFFSGSGGVEYPDGVQQVLLDQGFRGIANSDHRSAFSIETGDLAATRKAILELSAALRTLEN